jgi:hypothetical protein
MPSDTATNPAPPRIGQPRRIAAQLDGGLTVAFAIEELASLRHGTAAALRVEPQVRHIKTGLVIPSRALTKLSDDDVEAIDLETVAFAASLSAAQLPLILPQSFRTVAGRRGRAALSGAMKSAEALKARLIVELTDINRGTPSGRLSEVTGLINATCRGVFARLQPGRDAAAPVRDVRLHGLTLDGADLPETDGEAAGALLDFADQIRGLSPMLVAQGLADDGYFAVAEVAGFTHVSRRAAVSEAEAA